MMTETIDPVTTTHTVMDEKAQRELAARMVEQARAAGIDLVGPGGVLTGLTRQVLETAREEELSEHLGYDKHDPVGRNGRTPATAPVPRRC
jgi:putative transposase